ncbi:hypothetical protein [Entomobacter blattae]|uniref:Transglycosylase SLT domain-containing protein n=1 Tax=Entomobacter blattae TaxID=2762277 RepID=A0A7H1NU21_9PROT|nr:hypothetical protein [Entomobacter blattae]QNT79281.1 hypothetical protein JGUZn3_20780 [Entomobacter blattae]
MKIANDYGLDVGQLKHVIITPALKSLGLDGEAAVNLVTGTALAESHARYVQQINGPALGLWQMEPATHKDIWQNYLHYKPDLVAKLTFIMNGQERESQLMHNLAYGAALCRILYLRSKEPLPDAKDAVALSAYHKQVYNTQLGKANPQTNIPHFAAAIAA